MDEISALILHNDREGNRIRQRLSALPLVKSALMRTADEFKSIIRGTAYHVAIIGRWAPESKLVDMIAWMKRHAPGVRVLAHATQSEEVVPVFLAGASGYIFQDNLDSIGESLELLLAQGFYVPPLQSRKFLEDLLEVSRRYQTFMNANITPREIEIIKMQIQEKSRSKAAYRIGVEVTTVKSHNRIILKKLHMNRMKDVIKVYGQCLEADFQAA